MREDKNNKENHKKIILKEYYAMNKGFIESRYLQTLLTLSRHCFPFALDSTCTSMTIESA